MSIQAIQEKLQKRVAESDFDKVLRIDCGDEGFLVINKKEVTHEDVEADCTVSLSLADFVAMVGGDLHPAGAFMQGKLKIEGDMGAAMKLIEVL